MNRQKLKKLLKEEIINFLTEDITYNFNFEGKQFRVRFDVNSNPTKKGLKIQFVPSQNISTNPNEARQLINDLQIKLNQKLGAIGMAADFDADVPYQNVIGFTIKLGSISNVIIKALGGNIEQPLSNKSIPNLNSTQNEKPKT